MTEGHTYVLFYLLLVENDETDGFILRLNFVVVV